MAGEKAPDASPQKKKQEAHPIIIKRIKKYAAGHHGGAWKVAFADFMTALMAFFLVMWIVGLNQQSKEMIAAYFREPGAFSFQTGKALPVQVQQPNAPDKQAPLDSTTENNEGSSGSKEVPEGTMDMTPYFFAPDGSIYDSAMQEKIMKAVQDSIVAANEFSNKADSLKREIEKLISSSPDMEAFKSAIKLERDPRGLRIELIEQSDNMFFEVGSANLRPAAASFLQKFASQIAQRLPNSLQIEGHTDSRQYEQGSKFTNWDLSAERANTCRRVLQRGGLWQGQISAVTGYADRRLRVPGNPYDVANRRVSILIEQRSHKDFLPSEEEKK